MSQSVMSEGCLGRLYGRPRKWVVQRSFGWIMMHRRLARDYETNPEHSESMIRLAMISSVARRATDETTTTLHKP